MLVHIQFGSDDDDDEVAYFIASFVYRTKNMR